jgi:hypothetical protein
MKDSHTNVVRATARSCQEAIYASRILDAHCGGARHLETEQPGSYNSRQGYVGASPHPVHREHNLQRNVEKEDCARERECARQLWFRAHTVGCLVATSWCSVACSGGRMISGLEIRRGRAAPSEFDLEINLINLPVGSIVLSRPSIESLWRAPAYYRSIGTGNAAVIGVRERKWEMAERVHRTQIGLLRPNANPNVFVPEKEIVLEKLYQIKICTIKSGR